MNTATATSGKLTKRQQERVTIGIDLGDKWSHYCTLDDEGEVIEDGRFRTTPQALAKHFGDMPAARVVIESGTHSIWVSEHLRRAGHEVVVANVRDLQAISQSDRKSDRVDAEKLARYARVDPRILNPVTHRSIAMQESLTLIRAREVLVRTRTLLVNAVRGLTKPCGFRLPACSTATFPKRCLTELPEGLKLALKPLLEQIDQMTRQICAYEREIVQMGKTNYPETQALVQVHGVGPLTAVTYVLTLGDKQRFQRSRDVGCYLGLRPRRSQSGDRDPQLGITKAGNRYLRSLLTECANFILGPFGKDSALRRWGLQLASKGGKNARKRALIGVARKLAVLLHRLWVTQQEYVPFPERTAA